MFILYRYKLLFTSEGEFRIMRFNFNILFNHYEVDDYA